MSYGPFIFKDLVVIAAFVSLVAKKVDSRVFDAGEVFLRLKVFEAVGLVPAGREDIEGYLASY